ncbi:MAG: hypothetical protein DHS20C15_15850 [Planctomycetota bacterium]|nr:MAG: hypothetical protein DHS20C15_15850 [Planctomycetota bacterium]
MMRRMLRTWMILGLLLVSPADDREELFERGFDTITKAELLADLHALAGPLAEGRDSPSLGLDHAADHVSERLAAAGFTGLGHDGSFLLPFERELPAPDVANCALLVERTDGVRYEDFRFGVDYVPVWQTEGRARGEVVLLGFGIDSDSERFDEITGELSGKIALIVSGEPRHKRKFDGPEVSADAELYGKLENLREAGLSGVLVVRRPPLEEQVLPSTLTNFTPRGSDPPPEPEPEIDPENPPHELGFRHTWASWVGGGAPINPSSGHIPTLELTPRAANRLLGLSGPKRLDVIERLEEVDKKAKPLKPEFTGITVELAAASTTRKVPIHNVVGVLKGSDESLADEYVVLGAHYDHVGVDSRGRIGFGADDNASGTSAVLELAEAFAAAKPRRSILACLFAAEEDGLLGSEAFVANSPVPASQMVAMLNMDMIGHGSAKEVAVVGVPENPELGKLLKRADKLRRTKISKITTGQGQSVFKRSDHYSFHKRGVPVLFFFEGLPVGANPHYHTWRDTIDTVDVDKIARTTRLVFNTAWLLSEDDERPPAPEHTR